MAMTSRQFAEIKELWDKTEPAPEGAELTPEQEQALREEIGPEYDDPWFYERESDDHDPRDN
jgi:hypothetical protein